MNNEKTKEQIDRENISTVKNQPHVDSRNNPEHSTADEKAKLAESKKQ